MQSSTIQQRIALFLWSDHDQSYCQSTNYCSLCIMPLDSIRGSGHRLRIADQLAKILFDALSWRYHPLIHSSTYQILSLYCLWRYSLWGYTPYISRRWGYSTVYSFFSSGSEVVIRLFREVNLRKEVNQTIARANNAKISCNFCSGDHDCMASCGRVSDIFFFFY